MRTMRVNETPPSPFIAGLPANGRKPALSEPFRLACWLVYPELNQLKHAHNGHIRHLEPRLMQLLAYLAANFGKVLNRDELVQQLWPRVVVNENSLTRAVSELRKRLHDDAGSEFIQTIPKRGYRLNQPVSAVVSRPLAERGNTTWKAVLGHNRALQSTLVAACLSLVIGLVVVEGAQPTAEDWQQPLLADQLVAAPGPVGAEMSLSSIESGDLPLHGIEAPVISADQSRFAYIGRDLTGYTVYLGSMDDDSEPVAVFSCNQKLSNLAWSPVGDALLFARHTGMTPAALFDGESVKPQLLSLNLETGELRRLVEDKQSDKDDRPTVNLTAVSGDMLPGIVTPLAQPG